MTTPVSIIIPSYNSSKWICEAVESCLSQSHRHCEIIVVDDGSTDDTREKIHQHYCNAVKYIHKENGGLACARNTGLLHATGEYIQFLDADDLIKPDKLEKQVHQLALISGLSVSISDYYCCPMDDTDKELDWHQSPNFVTDRPLNELISRWERDLCIPAHCFLFDARIFKEHGIRFDESLPNHEDWDCWMRIFALNPQVRYVEDKMAVYRVNPDSMARNRVKMRYGFLQALRKQRRLCRNNLETVRLIDAKIDEVKLSYRDVSPRQRAWDAIPREIRSCLPWRVRRHFE